MSVWPEEPSGERLVCSFIVPGDPTTKSRARVTVNGTYTPRPTKEWERKVREYLFVAAPHLRPDADHSLGVRIRFGASTRQRRDIDNLAKAVLDALNGAAWVDDFQVDELVVSSVRGTPDPSTEVTIYTTGEWRMTCARCGERVRTSEGRRFCSKACYDESQKRGRYVHCFTCAKRIYRQNDALTQERWFCSPRCKELAKNRTLICRNCGQEFRVHKSAVNRRAFCSPNCGSEFHATRVKALQRQHRYRATCPTCGAPMARKGASQCRACYFRRLVAARTQSASVSRTQETSR